MATPQEQWAKGQAQWTPEPLSPTSGFRDRFGQYFSDSDVDALWDVAMALEEKGDIRLFADHLTQNFGLNPSPALQDYMVKEVIRSSSSSGQAYEGLKSPAHHEPTLSPREQYKGGRLRKRSSPPRAHPSSRLESDQAHSGGP